MNSKLINELVEFSDFHVGNEHYNKSHKEQQRIFMEFFAELIISECAAQCWTVSELESRGFVVSECTKRMRKHFGVEE